MTKIHEECGVFAILSPQKSHVAASTYYGLFELQHRGQESCGIVVNDDGVFEVLLIRNVKSPFDVLKLLGKVRKGDFDGDQILYLKKDGEKEIIQIQ